MNVPDRAIGTVKDAPTRQSLCVRMWTFTRVDWESHYSLDKILCLYDHAATTSTITKSLTLLLTPVPVLALSMGIEAIPLQDPALGLNNNPGFSIRTVIRWSSVATATGIQWYSHMPELSPPLFPTIISTMIQTSLVVGGTIAITEAVGVFPVPFSAFAVLPFFTTFGLFARTFWMRRTLWNSAKPEESRVKRGKLGKLLDLLAFCNQFISLYTISATVFSQIPAGYQLVMAGNLQVIKIWVKQTEWTKAQLHWSRNDLATLHVATNSQLFHQLFIAACFQTSKSVLTLVLIVLLGIG